jgi:hypothetical protein
MPYKIRFKHVGFMGDPKAFPCHFAYKVGEEIIYNGERLEGRICPGVLPKLADTLSIVMYSGSRHYERILFRYSGLSARDLSMKEHDGIGFRPLKEPPEGANRKLLQHIPQELPKDLDKRIRFSCGDIRTLSTFEVELIGLADGGSCIPYYRREMSILEKIKEEPGMTVDEILKKFSKRDREGIYPPLHSINVGLILDELAEVDYIELRDEKAYPKNPPK